MDRSSFLGGASRQQLIRRQSRVYARAEDLPVKDRASPPFIDTIQENCLCNWISHSLERLISNQHQHYFGSCHGAVVNCELLLVAHRFVPSASNYLMFLLNFIAGVWGAAIPCTTARWHSLWYVQTCLKARDLSDSPCTTCILPAALAW